MRHYFFILDNILHETTIAMRRSIAYNKIIDKGWGQYDILRAALPHYEREKHNHVQADHQVQCQPQSA